MDLQSLIGYLLLGLAFRAAATRFAQLLIPKDPAERLLYFTLDAIAVYNAFQACRCSQGIVIRQDTHAPTLGPTSFRLDIRTDAYMIACAMLLMTAAHDNHQWIPIPRYQAWSNATFIMTQTFMLGWLDPLLLNLDAVALRFVLARAVMASAASLVFWTLCHFHSELSIRRAHLCVAIYLLGYLVFIGFYASSKLMQLAAESFGRYHHGVLIPG